MSKGEDAQKNTAFEIVIYNDGKGHVRMTTNGDCDHDDIVLTLQKLLFLYQFRLVSDAIERGEFAAWSNTGIDP